MLNFTTYISCNVFYASNIFLYSLKTSRSNPLEVFLRNDILKILRVKMLRRFQPPQIFEPKKTLKRSIINGFSSLNIFSFNLVSRHLLHLQLSSAGHYFSSKFPKCLNILTTLRTKPYSCVQPP